MTWESGDFPPSVTFHPSRGEDPRGKERRVRVLLLSTADTELLSARSANAGYVTGNPSRLDVADLDGLCEGADVVVVRLLGGLKTWQEGVADLRRDEQCPISQKR